MPDEATAPTTTTEPEGTGGEGGEATTLTLEQALAELATVRREAASKRVENKDLKTFKDSIEALAAEAAQAELTESQRATARAEAAEAKLTELTTFLDDAALRSDIAEAKGLTAAQAARLTGSTREELELDADALIETFGIAVAEGEGDSTPPPSQQRVQPKLRPQGINPGEPPVNTDPASLAKAALERAGRI